MTVHAEAAVPPRSSDVRARRGRRPAPPWASGVVTGLESVVFSAGLVLALAFATVSSTPAADGSVSADWVGAWDVATVVWLLAHGVPATSGDVTVTLLPLGILVVAGVISASVATRLAVAARSSVVFAGIAYGVVVGVVAHAEGAGTGIDLRTGVVGALVCGTGASMGLKRARGFRFWAGRRMPDIARSGLRLGIGSCALSLAAGAATVVVWHVTHWAAISQSARHLDPDLAGGLSLAVGETAYVPTMSTWGLSYLSGRGFTVGSGSHYSPVEVVSGPIPGLPLLEALPSTAGGMLVALPLLLVAVGVLVRVLARRWLPSGRRGFESQVIGVAILAALVWGAVALASGSIGAGVLSEVGAQPIAVALSVAGLVAGGMFGASVIAAALRRPGLRVEPPGGDSTTPPTRPTSPRQQPRTRGNSEQLPLW